MPNKQFGVCCRFKRFDAYGNQLRSSRKLYLYVTGLEVDKSSCPWIGVFYLSDGSRSAPFQIRMWAPSKMAQTAMNYQRWVNATMRGKEKEDEREIEEDSDR